jgi:soluble lytic murein transglycosylase-like protein
VRATIVAALIVHSAAALAQEAGQVDHQTQARIEILQPYISQAARRFPVPEAWIRAVIAAESGGRTELDGKPITSVAGAMGPMQVMPKTYEDMRRRYGLGSDPYDPENNILAGTAYLGELYRRFGSTGMFAAYNAGPDRYQQFLDERRSLPAETEAYLATLDTLVSTSAREPSFASGPNLFFPLKDRAQPSPATHQETNGGGLFVPLAPAVPDPGTEKKGR